MQKLSIQMLKDNGRTVIILEGATRERDEMAYQIVSAYLSPINTDTEANAVEHQTNTLCVTETAQNINESSKKELESITNHEIPQVRGLKPPKSKPVENSDIITIGRAEDYRITRMRGTQTISSGQFAGITPVEALTQYDEVALVELFHMAADMSDCEERIEIIRACKQYMYNLPELVNEKYQTRDNMIAFIRNISDMTPMDAFINGYANLDSFCNGAGDNEIESVFTNIVWSLAERGNRAMVS